MQTDYIISIFSKQTCVWNPLDHHQTCERSVTFWLRKLDHNLRSNEFDEERENGNQSIGCHSGIIVDLCMAIHSGEYFFQIFG